MVATLPLRLLRAGNRLAPRVHHLPRTWFILPTLLSNVKRCTTRAAPGSVLELTHRTTTVALSTCKLLPRLCFPLKVIFLRSHYIGFAERHGFVVMLEEGMVVITALGPGLQRSATAGFASQATGSTFVSNLRVNATVLSSAYPSSRKHYKSHTKPFECLLCHHRAAQPREMRKHIDVHFARYRFYCNCGVGFTRLDNLLLKHVKMKNKKNEI